MSSWADVDAVRAGEQGYVYVVVYDAADAVLVAELDHPARLGQKLAGVEVLFAHLYEGRPALYGGFDLVQDPVHTLSPCAVGYGVEPELLRPELHKNSPLKAANFVRIGAARFTQQKTPQNAK